MVKFGYVKCENCGKEYKKSQASRHKCSKYEEIEKCPICCVKVDKSNYSKHYKRCQGREFWTTYKPCFLFILRGVKRWNKMMKNRAFIGTRSECKYFLDRFDKSGSINQNREFLKELGTQREENALKDMRERAKEMGIDFDTLYLSDAIKDAECNNFPGISARQVIFTFLKNKKIGDTELINRIDNKLYKVDYPTDVELLDNEYVFSKILELRNIYRYNEVFQKFYYLLVECYENQNKYKCPYCSKYFYDVVRHFKVCYSFKQCFYKSQESRNEVISNYLKRYEGYAKWSQAKIVYYIDYYKESSHDYFLDTINEHLRNRAKFLRKIEYEEDQERRAKGAGLGKKFVCDLINEVRVWCGHKPHEYKIKRGKRIKVKDGDKDEEENEKSDEEIDNKSEESYQTFKDEYDKDGNEELEEEESINYNTPRRIPEKQVQAMKMLLKKKEKKIEPPVEEEPKEEPNKVEEIGDDFDLFTCDILANKK